MVVFLSLLLSQGKVMIFSRKLYFAFTFSMVTMPGIFGMNKPPVHPISGAAAAACTSTSASAHMPPKVTWGDVTTAPAGQKFAVNAAQQSSVVPKKGKFWNYDKCKTIDSYLCVEQRDAYYIIETNTSVIHVDRKKYRVTYGSEVASSMPSVNIAPRDHYIRALRDAEQKRHHEMINTVVKK